MAEMYPRGLIEAIRDNVMRDGEGVIYDERSAFSEMGADNSLLGGLVSRVAELEEENALLKVKIQGTLG